MLMSLLPAAFSFFQGRKQIKEGRKLGEQADGLFNTSLDYANKGLDSARGMQTIAHSTYNGRMAGAGAYENSIYGNQANTLAAAGRNSTSAAQQLALAGAVQGNSNDAFGNLALMEAQDKQRRYGDLFAANQGVNAGLGNLQNVYGNRSAQTQNQANALAAAGQQNQFNGIKGWANAIEGTMGQAMSMFSGGMLGGKSGGGTDMPDFNSGSYSQKPPRFGYNLPGLQNSLNNWG